MAFWPKYEDLAYFSEALKLIVKTPLQLQFRLGYVEDRAGVFLLAYAPTGDNFCNYLYARLPIKEVPSPDMQSFVNKVLEARDLATRIYVTEQNAKKAKTVNYRGV